MLTSERRRGPAHARNRGAEAATGDVLLFIDADCVAAPDAVARVRAAFAADPSLNVLVGSYDDAPGDRAFLSQYRNLLHHYTHQTAGETLSTFWGACGAIRPAAFAAVGGFDEGYDRPCIEDVELGYRLEAAGYEIRLDKRLQVKHLKAWTPLGMLKTDLLRRAVPWTELLLRRGTIEDNLNVSVAGRASTALIGGVLVAGIAAVLAPTPPLLAGALLAGALLAAAFLALNLPFYRFLRTVRGRHFAVRAAPWHALYFLYSGLGFVLGSLRYGSRAVREALPALASPEPPPTPCPASSSPEPGRPG